jgi:hypothetical protein
MGDVIFLGILILGGYLFIPLHIIFKKQEQKNNLISGLFVIYCFVVGFILLIWTLYQFF